MERILCFGLAVLLMCCTSVWNEGYSQTCTSSPTTISSNVNLSSISWTATGGASVAQCNAMATGTAFTGNVVVDIANNKTITVNTDLNITGNFVLTGGPGSTLSVTGGHAVHVYGTSHYMGDPANNGVQYKVVSSTDKIIVDGTLYGKNNNAFTGDGSISGGSLNVKNGSTCGSPCPITGGFSDCTSGDGFCSSYGALPILLFYFDASQQDHEVVLNWTTSMEENFDRFIVQRSLNAETFEALGEVTGAGKNVYDIKNEYRFIDKNPVLGQNYYRLQAIDLDGSFEYFSIVTVDFQGAKKLWISPNPSSGNTIRYSTNFQASEGDHVMLINSLGKKVAADNISYLNGLLSFETPISPGIYILKYFSNGGELTARVIVD